MNQQNEKNFNKTEEIRITNRLVLKNIEILTYKHTIVLGFYLNAIEIYKTKKTLAIQKKPEKSVLNNPKTPPYKHTIISGFT